MSHTRKVNSLKALAPGTCLKNKNRGPTFHMFDHHRRQHRKQSNFGISFVKKLKTVPEFTNPRPRTPSIFCDHLHARQHSRHFTAILVNSRLKTTTNSAQGKTSYCFSKSRKTPKNYNLSRTYIQPFVRRRVEDTNSPREGFSIQNASKRLARESDFADNLSENLTFTNARLALKIKDTNTLLFNTSMLYMCNVGAKLAGYAPSILSFLDHIGLGRVGYGIVRNTFFKQFCVGETEEETLEYVEKLSKHNIASILDLCIEDEGGDEEAFEKNANYVIGTIGLAAKHHWIHFSHLKVSNLIDGPLLQKASALLYYQRRHPEFQVAWNTLGARRYGSLHEDQTNPPPQFSQADLEKWNRLLQRLHRICDAASRSGRSLMIDAEGTPSQAAIDYLVYVLQEKYNRQNAVILQTYQMYLRESLARLRFDIEDAKKKGIVLGVKIVRGAYISSENARAKRLKYQSPIHDEIDLTHDAYHRGIELVLDNIDNCKMLIGTHKSASVKLTARLMAERDIPPNHPHVEFSQLFGMADLISNTLAASGYRISKLLAYGPVQQVIPYLSRRLEENNDLLSGTRVERVLFRKELFRRWREDK